MRDGYLLKKCFDTINRDYRISTQYIYAPRLVKILGDLGWAGRDDYFDTLVQYYSDALPDFGALVNGTADRTQRQRIFMDNMAMIKPYARAFRARYMEYAAGIRADAAHVFGVDMSSGSQSSQRILNGVLGDRMRGMFYLATGGTDLPHYNYCLTGDARLSVGGLYEVLLSAPETGIADFCDGMPVYNPETDADVANIRVFEKSAVATLDFVDEFHKNIRHLPTFDMPFDMFAAWANAFFDCLTPCDVDALAEVSWFWSADNRSKSYSMADEWKRTHRVGLLKRMLKRRRK